MSNLATLHCAGKELTIDSLIVTPVVYDLLEQGMLSLMEYQAAVPGRHVFIVETVHSNTLKNADGSSKFVDGWLQLKNAATSLKCHVLPVKVPLFKEMKQLSALIKQIKDQPFYTEQMSEQLERISKHSQSLFKLETLIFVDEEHVKSLKDYFKPYKQRYVLRDFTFDNILNELL